MCDVFKPIPMLGEWWDGIAALTDKQRGGLMQAIFAEHGACDMPELDQTTSAIFSMMLPTFREFAERQAQAHERRVAAGQKGGIARASNAKQCQAKPSIAKAPKPDIDLRDADFDEFYTAFPVHKGRQDARKAWDKAIKAGVLPAQGVLMEKLSVQKASAQWAEGRYIPHPASWLNGRRWEDEPSPEQPQQRRLFSREQMAMDETYKNGMEVLQELRERGAL